MAEFLHIAFSLIFFIKLFFNVNLITLFWKCKDINFLIDDMFKKYYHNMKWYTMLPYIWDIQSISHNENDLSL